MIEGESLIKQGQLAMGDTKKYPQFAGNVAVVDTDKPYGPDKMEFKFYTEKSPDKVGYHWNNHARSYLNIGRAMAAEMHKLDKPKLPSRLVAHGCDEGVQLIWQLGTEKPRSIEILRNGKSWTPSFPPTQTTFVDTDGAARRQQLRAGARTCLSGKQKLSAACDTSVTGPQGIPQPGRA